ISPCYMSAYPNAGLPDPLSPTGFPETAETFAPKVVKWVQNGWLNLVGGCCGTTPDHIRALANLVRDYKPRSTTRLMHNRDLGSAPVPGAGESVALSRTSINDSVEPNIRYAKRRLPHFDKPWAIYAITIGTRRRRTLSPTSRTIV